MTPDREQQLASASALAATLPLPRLAGVLLRALVRTGRVRFEAGRR